MCCLNPQGNFVFNLAHSSLSPVLVGINVPFSWTARSSHVYAFCSFNSLDVSMVSS